MKPTILVNDSAVQQPSFPVTLRFAKVSSMKDKLPTRTRLANVNQFRLVTTMTTLGFVNEVVGTHINFPL